VATPLPESTYNGLVDALEQGVNLTVEAAGLLFIFHPEGLKEANLALFSCNRQTGLPLFDAAFRHAALTRAFSLPLQFQRTSLAGLAASGAMVERMYQLIHWFLSRLFPAMRLAKKWALGALKFRAQLQRRVPHRGNS
jgi:hypothetical protein